MRTVRNIRRVLAVAIIAFAGSVLGIGTPTGLSVAPIDYTQAACNIDCSARLSWTAPSEGAATGYRIYRRIAAAETPTLAGEIDAATTSFTDSTATIGQLYLYTVTAVDADGESAESAAVSYRKVENVATKANGTWTISGELSSWANQLGNLNDGNVSTFARIELYGGFFYTFNTKPYVSSVRAYASSEYNSSNVQSLQGLRVSKEDRVDVRDPAATPAADTFTSKAWVPYTVHESFAETVWTGFLFGGSSQYPMLCEFEAYGYFSSSLLAAPSGLATEIVNNQVVLSWVSGVNAVFCKIYRKVDGGEWNVVASDVTGSSFTDQSVERGNTYIYRVAAVSAVGDELSSSECAAVVPAGAPVWWNFLNVKSIAYPGAAAWPANPRPHFLSRDRAGTTLLAAMSTEDGGLPVMTFDLQSLINGYGELLSRDTKAKAWWMWGQDAYAPWQDKGFCWKGAAATEDLIFWANGTATGYSVAVVNRADDSEDTYILRNADGNAFYFWMNGGVATSADGNSLYSNCGAEGEKNRIVKFNIDRANKSLRLSDSYAVEGITSIRNFAVYTVGGTELAVFGEGEGGGKLGVLDLSTGVSTVMSAPEITGKIANVKLADTEDGLFLVAQNDDGFVAVYSFDAAEKTITLEKTIDAATMRALYGASGNFECRNLEMTADGRYAFILCDGGADTRLSVIGASLKTIPESAPQHLSATVDMSTLWQARLDWINASGVTATGIRVLRAQTGKPGYAVLADLPLGTTTYTDASAVGGVDYTYAVAYINSYAGKTVAGPVATAECTPWQSLMPYKKQVISNIKPENFEKAFDGDRNSGPVTDCEYPMFGIQFREPVVFRALRCSAMAWAVLPDYGYYRLDGVGVYGGGEGQVTLSGNVITGRQVTPLGTFGTPRDANWFDVASTDHTSDKWLYLLLYKPDWNWHGEINEVEFYGAVKSLKDAAESKSSEAATTVAPVLSANAGTLVWTDEPDETVAVVIYRSRMAEGPYVQIAEVAPGIGTYTDTTAPMAVKYYYRAAFITEYHGVNLEGAQAESVTSTKPLVVESVLLTENGVSPAAKKFGYAVKRAGGVALSEAEKAFDGNESVAMFWDGYPHYGKNLYVGYNFNEPVKITKAKVVAFRYGNSTWNQVTLRASSVSAYLNNPGDTSYVFPDNSQSAILKTFGWMESGDEWVDANLSTDWVRCVYLCGAPEIYWCAAVRELELWGYTESMVKAAQPVVVQPVENVTARMDDTTLTLNWKLANSAATAITVKRRVSGGAWTEIASLAGDATSLATDTVSIGRYNEYRIEVSDGTETVWAEKDFAVCPLLSKGTRTVMGCTPTSAYDYLAVDAAPGGFTATVEFAGASQSGLGLTPGEGKGNSVNLIVRKDINTSQTLALSRFVDVNILALYAHDDGIDKVYAQEVWTSYGNTTSTRFRIRKTGKTYQLGVVASDGTWADVAPYTFVGDDRIGNGSCLVGVSISDPNLATLSQIAPIELRTLIRRGMTVVFR